MPSERRAVDLGDVQGSGDTSTTEPSFEGVRTRRGRKCRDKRLQTSIESFLEPRTKEIRVGGLIGPDYQKTRPTDSVRLSNCLLSQLLRSETILKMIMSSSL